MTYRQIKIAVCGHRHLTHLERLEMGIQEACKKIQAVYGNASYQVFSCLAEGADQLLVDRLIESLGAVLIAVLPLPEDEYFEDFKTPESLLAFKRLKLQADRIISQQHTLERPLAYQKANHILLENCDLLVAIWDGKPARGIGGTAETVNVAGRIGLPVLWIQADEGLITGSLLEERLVSFR